MRGFPCTSNLKMKGYLTPLVKNKGGIPSPQMPCLSDKGVPHLDGLTSAGVVYPFTMNEGYHTPFLKNEEIP